MQLQRFSSKQFAFLPSGILVVEPNPALLNATAQLLLAADYFTATSNDALPASELQKTDVRVAILSKSLGIPTVAKLAREIRFYYPSAAILIFGLCALELDNQLYDEAIDSHCRPEQLLNTLFRLTQESSDRLMPSRERAGSHPLSLAGLDWMSLHKEAAESDPSKQSTSDTDKPAAGLSTPLDEISSHLV